MLRTLHHFIYRDGEYAQDDELTPCSTVAFCSVTDNEDPFRRSINCDDPLSEGGTPTFPSRR